MKKAKYEDAMSVKDGYRSIKQISCEELCSHKPGEKTKKGEYEMEEDDEEDMD